MTAVNKMQDEKAGLKDLLFCCPPGKDEAERLPGGGPYSIFCNKFMPFCN